MLKQILESGTLVGEGMDLEIQKLSQDHIDFFLSLKDKPLVFDHNILKALTNPEIKIIKKKFRTDKKSVQDVINRYNDRYNVLKEELMKKSELRNLVSISALTTSEKVSVIGMWDGKYLEDQTGRVELSLPIAGTNVPVINNEVVGITGEKKDNKFLVQEIIYPDVVAKPLKKSEKLAKVFIGKSIPEGEVCKVNYAIIQEEQKLSERVATVELNGYGEFEIGGIRFLVVRESLENINKEINKEGNLSEVNVCKEILKRRNLFYKDMWIKAVPDVFVSFSKETFVDNYKGITVIGVGNAPILLDLQTREWTI
jgi:DNA polymerase II small subunit/DNA polymerase delta subunit B